MYKISIDFDRVTYEWDYVSNSVKDSTYDCNGIPGSVREYEVTELTADALLSALKSSFTEVMGNANDAIQVLEDYKFSLDRFEDANGNEDSNGAYFVVYEAYVSVIKDGEDVTNLLGELGLYDEHGFYR